MVLLMIFKNCTVYSQTKKKQNKIKVKCNITKNKNNRFVK